MLAYLSALLASIGALFTSVSLLHPKGKTNSSRVTVVVGAPVAGPPAPAPVPPPPLPEPATTPQQSATALAPLNLSDMRLWNYAGRWHASEWANGMGPLPWKYDHVQQPTGADTTFTLDANGAPELQAMGGTPTSGRGLWEADVTLPKLEDGLVVAPLWLWDGDSHDEVDFELAGRRGLDVTMHASANGAMQQDSVRLFAGRDMSGERHRFGIKVDEGAGFVEMYLDGQLVHRWSRNTARLFVSRPLKPMFSMWAADPNNGGFVNWVGQWRGIAANEVHTMVVHGYGFTAAS